jgi:hypothetical protein
MIINNNSPIAYNTQIKTAKPQEEADQMPKDGVTLGQSAELDAPVKKKWTFMHYAAGDNNLDQFITGDVNEMETVGSDANTNIVAMLDHTRGKACKTYFITKDNDAKNITSPVLKDHGGKVNMADPKVLASFIADTVKKYPAEHYMLDIGDHGGGWSGAISDDGSGGWMSTPQIKEALDMAQKETGVKLDVLAFDCCLMATGEVAAELKDHANFMVASEETEGGAGWNYNNVLGEKRAGGTRDKYKNILMSPEVIGDVQRALRNRITLEPREFVIKQVDAAQAHQNDLPTMAAIDMSQVEGITKASKAFADSIIATSTPKATLSNLVGETQDFSGNKDYYHFAELITKDPSIADKGLKEAAQGVMDAINKAVIAEEHEPNTYGNAHGLTIELNDVGSKWQELQFNKDVPNWKDAINKF